MHHRLWNISPVWGLSGHKTSCTFKLHWKYIIAHMTFHISQPSLPSLSIQTPQTDLPVIKGRFVFRYWYFFCFVEHFGLFCVRSNKTTLVMCAKRKCYAWSNGSVVGICLKVRDSPEKLNDESARSSQHNSQPPVQDGASGKRCCKNDQIATFWSSVTFVIGKQRRA